MTILLRRNGINAKKFLVSSPSYMPTDVTGLIKWHRADDVASAGQNGPVNSWPDRVQGGGTLSRISGYTAPVYLSNSFGMGPSVWTNTASSVGLRQTGYSLQGDFTAIMVGRQTELNGRGLIGMQSNTTAVSRFYFSISSSTVNNARGVWSGSGNPISDTVSNVSTNVVHISTVQVANGYTELFHNGMSDGPTTGTLGTAANNTGSLGFFASNVSSGNSGRGYIYEFMIFNKVLSAQERAKVHTYLQDRYGIPVSDYIRHTAGPDTFKTNFEEKF